MISKKILAQSAAAGLMAGAVLVMPLFLYGPERGSFDKKPCSYKQDKLEISYGPYGQPTFRAAPPVSPRADRVENSRTLDERNRAARQALGEITANHGAEQAATDAAHTFAIRTMAAQTATRIKQRSRTRSDGHRTASEITEAAMSSSEDQRARALELMDTHGPVRTNR
ncbi:MAG: hypothetical protein ACLFVJ_02275 [Persicimonas sp.]